MGAAAAAVCCKHEFTSHTIHETADADDDDANLLRQTHIIAEAQVPEVLQEKLEASVTQSTDLPESVDAQGDVDSSPPGNTEVAKNCAEEALPPPGNKEVLEDHAENQTPEAVCRVVEEFGKKGEWVQAEAYILKVMDALPDDEQPVFWKQIARDSNVKKTLISSRVLMEARRSLPQSPEELVEKSTSDASIMCAKPSIESRRPSILSLESMRSKASIPKSEKFGFPGWTGLAPVRLDMKTLLKAPAEYFRGIDSSAKLFWRYEKNELQIKILLQLPTDHPTLPTSWPLAVVSMLSEVDLMSAFNPVVVAPPQLVRPPSLDFITWKEQVKIRFVMSEVGIQEMTRLFTEDGLIVLKISKVANTSDQRVQDLQIPRGYKYTEGADESITALCISERQFTSVTTVRVPLPQGYKIPSWLLNFILAWVFPTMIRKMAKVASTISSDPEYVRRFEADEVGLYARIAKAVSDAKEYEKSTGRVFNAYNPVTRPRCDSFRAGNLSERVDLFKTRAGVGMGSASIDSLLLTVK